MPQKDIDLEQISPNFPIKLVYNAKYEQQTFLNYLQNIRSGVSNIILGETPEDNLLANSYRNNLSNATVFLANQIKAFDFDIILRPPSSREDAKPYLERIIEICPDSNEISECIKRKGSTKSGAGSTFCEYRKSLSYSCNSIPETSIKLLIVDDVYNTGRTVASVLDLLLDKGFSIDKVIVACPLLIDNSTE